MLKLFYILPLLFIFQNTWGQLVTSTTQTPSSLVQNTLLGAGVNAFNISYTGASDAIGFFNGSNCNIGLSSGIIMTTGTVSNHTSLFGAQQGPFGPNDEPGAGVDNNRPGDTQLEALANGVATHNAAILEFDFDAVGNVVSFNYVFASDEYPEFVNAGYNDVFAFWISGPGINGSQNIALIPNTNTPVTIDNVNANSNSSYFVSNGDGNSAPQNSDNTVVQYDGFTTVLTATANVQCGNTYHIRIAICDVGDGVYDSGVFLEAQSFTSVAPMQQNHQINTLGNLSNNQLLEGCSDASITFTRNDSIAYSQTFDITVGGSATNGVDFTNVPNTITFPAGQSTATINLQTIADQINENTEDIVITMTYSGMCGQQTALTTTFQIVDQTPLTFQMPASQEISCITGTSVDLIPVVTGGTPTYNYNWSTGEQTSNITVSPTDTTTYILTVTDACGTQSITDSTIVTYKIFDPLVISTSNDTTVFCPNSPVDLSVVATGGSGNLSYSWSPNVGNTANVSVQTLQDQTYTVTVSDQCNNQQVGSITITVLSPVLTTDTYGDTTICPYGNAVIGVNANGGNGNFTYVWNTGETVDEIQVSTGQSTYFYVDVFDACNTYSVRDSVLVATSKPTAQFFTNPTEGIEKKPIYFGNQSLNATHYYWDFGNDETSIEPNPYNTYTNEGEYLVTLIAYDYLGCTDTISKYFVVHPEYFGYVPNAFSPNNDGVNDYFRGSFIGVTEVELLIFNRWGQIIYQSSGGRSYWDGTFNGENCPTGIYVYKYKVKDYSGLEHEYTGHISLIR